MGRYRGRGRTRRLAIATLAGSVVLSTGLVAGSGMASGAPDPASATVALAGSYLGAPDATPLGSYQSSVMGVEVVLQPRQASTMDSELAALYDPSSPSYHQWLRAGSFASRFAPSASARRSVGRFLDKA